MPKTINKTCKAVSRSIVATNIICSQSTLLMKLFEDGLTYLYWAEKALTKAINKMIKNATTEELIDMLEDHFKEIQKQVLRIEHVFKLIGKKPVAKKCDTMEALIIDADEIINDSWQPGSMRDIVIISAAQRVEAFKIISYDNLCQFAETLGLNDAVEFLEVSLNEEKMAVVKLSAISMGIVNIGTKEEIETYAD